MKNKLTYLLLIALTALMLFPQAALAKEIEFEVSPGIVWRINIPDSLLALLTSSAAKTTTPVTTPCPTTAPKTTAPSSTSQTNNSCVTTTTKPTSTAKPTATASPTATPGGSGSEGANQAAQNSYEAQMLGWVNAERAKQMLKPYVLDSSLTYWARAKSQDMIDKNYFAHTSPTYGSSYNMLKTGGVSFTASSENIARYGSLEKAHAGLMSSAGHYANIMSKSMTRGGIGVVRNSSGAFYVTQLFVR